MQLIFRDKGLARFYETGKPDKLKLRQYEKKISRILQFVEGAQSLRDFEAGIFDAHKLTGERAGQYALNISGNFRLILAVDPTETRAEILEIVDYH